MPERTSTAPRRRRMPGLFVPVYQSLLDCKKTVRALRLLKLELEPFIGYIVKLWLWSLTNADVSGLVEGGTSEELEIAVRWRGVPGELYLALTIAGFIDEEASGWRIHDWDITGGRVRQDQEAEALRWRRDRSGKGREEEPSEDKERPPSPTGRASSPPPQGGEGIPYSGGDSTGVPPETPPELHDRVEKSRAIEAGGPAKPATPSATPPNFPVFPCQGRTRTWELSPSTLAQMVDCYPRLDVVAVLRKMHAKVVTGAAGPYTAKGMARTCWSWLDREVHNGRSAGDNGGRPGQAPAAPAPPVGSDRNAAFGRELAAHRRDPEWDAFEAAVRSDTSMPVDFLSWKRQRRAEVGHEQ